MQGTKPEEVTLAKALEYLSYPRELVSVSRLRSVLISLHPFMILHSKYLFVCFQKKEMKEIFVYLNLV